MRFGKSNATDQEIIDALVSSNAYDFISKKMTNGIDTVVGASGGQLSGGQKQRIAIARAFIKKPKILLLDEATSALDKKNEKIVQDAIDRIRKSLGAVTTVVIAHRLSTIKDADNILVMRYGELMEEGSHEELLKKYPSGIYAQFVQQQEAAEKKAEEEEKDNKEIAEEDLPGEMQLQISSRQSKLFKSKRVSQFHQNDVEMWEKANTNDEYKEKQLNANRFEVSRSSMIKRIFKYNNPRWMFWVAMFSSIVVAFIQPIFGIVFSKILAVLTVPEEYVVYVMGKQYDGYVRHELNKWVFGLLGCAGAQLVFGFCSLYFFSYLGENVTLQIRKELYESILRKNIGWHDQQDHSPAVLTSIMAEETSQINGVASEVIASMLQASFAVFIGVGIGFYYCWQIATVCIIALPAMGIGTFLGAKFKQNIHAESGDQNTQANLLAGDAIINYRTVASFANEEAIIKKYEEMLTTTLKSQYMGNHKAGIAFGFSQFAMMFIFAALFYSGGKIQDNVKGLKPENIFIAIFSMMFGAM